MRPSALLITMNRYAGVVKRLRDIEKRVFPGVNVRAETADSFDDIPPLLRAGDTLVALDGHGWDYGNDAYLGTGKVFTQFRQEYVRDEQGTGITAPIVVLAFCWGGTDPFLRVLERSIDRSRVAFLGRTDEVDFDDHELIYPSLLQALAGLGRNPDPATAHARLQSIAPNIGAGWRAELLHRRNDPA
jgi:hypothetical protein